jgi:hypothetical protein
LSTGPGCGDRYSERDARIHRRAYRWLLAASLAYVAATAALRFRSGLPSLVPWLAVGLAVGLFALAIRAYLQFLRAADELQRRIETEALAIGFAAGTAFSLLYPLFERLGAPELGWQATPLVLMLSGGIGAWFGVRRYSRTGSGDQD